MVVPSDPKLLSVFHHKPIPNTVLMLHAVVYPIEKSYFTLF